MARNMELHPDRNYEALFFILYIVFLFPPLLFLLGWKLPTTRSLMGHHNWYVRRVFLLSVSIVPYGLLRGLVAVLQLAL